MSWLMTLRKEAERPQRRALAAIVLATATMLAGCGVKVPPEKAAYVGEWRSPTMVLLMTRDGRVRYKRHEGHSTVSVNGPLKDFQGDSFEVGVAFLSTKFVVSTPPYEDEGQWKMVVDGEELVKVRGSQ